MRMLALVGLGSAIVLILVLGTSVVLSDPPVPKNIAGRVFLSSGAGAPNGIPVVFNNTNILQYFTTQVFAPPIPQLAGSYSKTINGSTGDLIIVRAYNSTHYGETNVTLAASTTYANVTINMTRPSEANVTILSPADNTEYNVSALFNVTVRIGILVTDGTACNVTLLITDESVINTSSGSNSTNYLGDLSVGSFTDTIFELEAKSQGYVNITVIGTCAGSVVSFSMLESDTLENISVSDSQPPIVTLIFPQNQTENRSTTLINLLYNVTDEGTVSRCDLNINNQFNTSSAPITKDATLNFTVNFSNGNYTWRINCSDSLGNENSSETRYLNVSVYYPLVHSLSLDQGIVLNAGSVKAVQCNFTVEDGNGYAEITETNATLHASNETTSGIQNYNYRYLNTSCANTGNSGNESNYSCTFSLQYFAVNGTWNCTPKATDANGLQYENTTNTSVDPLYAINVSALILNYGGAAPNSYTSEKNLNITNLGNQLLNVSLRAYGGSDELTGVGYAMTCVSGDNISVADERFAFSAAVPYALKTPLTSTNQDAGITMQKQTSLFSQIMNETYWQMFIPLIAVGECQGTVVITAGAP